MIGRTLGRYRVLAQIGAGGMGVVYRAHDERLDRDVALKVLPPGTLADETARRRFHKEAQSLSRLNHPNIATVHDFDTQEGVDFLVMEEVPGSSLDHRLETGGPLPEKEVARYGMQLAEGLAAAHERGVVHRDLKPGNLQVTPDGRLKILDFGLARWRQAAGPADITRSVSEAQHVVGTLPYMAPEQVQGEPADARTDIYGAGAVCYEMATGGPPFSETQGPRLIDAILHQSPVTPRALNPHVSPELERIILKCLEKDPEDRYQSAKELLVDLRRLGASAPRSAVVPAKRRRFALPLATALTAAAVLAVFVVANPGDWRGRILHGASPVGPIRSLAVLPLNNFSGDPSQDYFADGMTEELTANLARLGSLRVISRTSVMQYKGVHKPLPEIARELNVEAIVEGSVLRDHDRVRITAQLIRAATDQHLWAETYDRKLSDVLDLQSEVARKIAEQINITLTPLEKTRLASRRSVDPEAHDRYLQGLYHLNKGTGSELRAAIDQFEQALAKAPTYAPAYSGLADCYLALSTFYEPAREAMPKAKAAAQKALALDESLAAAHNSMGNVNMFFDWDWPATEREARRAIELDPNNANAHDLYAVYFYTSGRYDQGLAELQRAHELDPYSLMIAADLIWWPTMGRQYDLAIENGRKAIAMEPNYAAAHSWVAVTYALKEQFPEAVKEAETGHRLDDSPIFTSMLAYAYAKAGRRQEAERVLVELKEALKKRSSCSYEVGVAYVALGQKDEAFRWLQNAYDDRSVCTNMIKVDPRLDPIRSDRRYTELARRVGAPQ